MGKRRAETRAVEMSRFWLISGGEVRSLSNPEAELLQIFGVWQPNGIPTGAAAAMRYPASAACVRLISSLTAECPVHVYRRTDDDGRERDRDHVAERLLNDFANRWTASTDFIREMTICALHNEHAFARVVRTGREKRPHELQILPRVTVESDEFTGEPTYLVPRKGGGQERLKFHDVLHLKSPTGGAPSQQVSRAIELGLLLELSTLELFRNGGRPSGLLTFKARVDATTAAQLQNDWYANLNDNPGKVAVLGGDVTFTQLSLKSTDAETFANRRYQVLEVARGYGVSPTLLAELEDASLNNSEALGRQFLSYTLAPWLTAWVGAISRCMLSEEERLTSYIEFQTANLVSADIKARFEAIHRAVGGPWMPANEARALENRPPLPGGERLYMPQGAPAPKEPADA